jgi:carboxyl-terminal processing protease
MRKTAIIHKFGALLAILLLSLMLAACSSNNEINSNSNAQGAISLPAINVDGKGNVTGITSTPVVAATVAPPTDTPLPTSTATPMPTPTLIPIATPPNPTPTLSGTLEAIDKEYELGIIKKAYDAINEHLFRDPNPAKVIKGALVEVSNTTGVKISLPDFDDNVQTNWDKFKTAFGDVVDKAAANSWKYPKGDLAHRAIIAMTDAVGDGHTYFMNKAATTSRQNLLTGNNTQIGFGITPTFLNGKVYITKVVSNAPADKAGMKAGDLLIQYDDLKIDDKNWETIRQAQENETHKFTVMRQGEPNPVVLSITKQKYNVPTVEYRIINGNIGYIIISDFFTNVATEVDKAMRDLQSKGATAWVIDVRGNPGGVGFDQVAGRFLENGLVMGYDYDRTSRNEVKVSNQGISGSNRGKPFTPQFPLAILINDGSASASEIVALVFRDFNLGPIIGTKSAGALGYSQSYPLGDGTAISVTIREYESKGGEKLNTIGISPDIVVERTIDDLVAGRDPQLAVAVVNLEAKLAKKGG